jgi:ATP-dependent DNA helicase RecG
MIVHRNYTSSYDSIVKVFPDRIEFYNPGALPDNISVQLKLTGLMRRGVERNISQLKTKGLPERVGLDKGRHRRVKNSPAAGE